MKILFGFLLLFSQFTWAKEKCLTPEQADMSAAPDLRIPETDYSVSFCYRSAKAKKNTAPDEFYHDLIILKNARRILVEGPTEMAKSIGRISNLVLEMQTKRFIAVTYDAGEACNGLMIFDIKYNRVAFRQGCLNPTDTCHVVQLNKTGCEAKIACKDESAEDASLEPQTPVTKTFQICGGMKKSGP